MSEARQATASPIALSFIGGAMIAGNFGGTWWLFVPLCATGLTLLSSRRLLPLWLRAKQVNARLAWWWTAANATVIAIVAASAAFAVGSLLHRLWD